ncbi:MAG: hypothetical protein H6737_20285 [Alphaproteobacteria bacterium]|nr:hypothetical protein [Alphaproteobacteria bacterium]
MANNSGNSKKGGQDLDKKIAAPEALKEAVKPENLFGRHGNEQIKDVTSSALAQQGSEAGLLAAMATEQTSESAVDQSWWQDEEVVRSNQNEEEEEARVLAANTQDDDAKRQEAKDQADKDSQRGRRLAPQEELALLNEKKAQMSAGALAEQELNILKDAEKAGLSEEDKAAMLVKQGDVKQEVLDEQTGAVRALVAAEQMPESLAAFQRDAAQETSKTPLNERDTIRNVTEEIRLISKQIQNHPKLTDPNMSVEDKATAMVDILAYELDVPTRESVAAHPFVGLHEDLVFDPQSILAINSIAGSSREVRALGGFAIVAWQMCVDQVKNKLAAMDEDESLDENDLWKDCLGGLANKMYVDALLKPEARG